MDLFAPPCARCGQPAQYPTEPGWFYCAACSEDFSWESAQDAQVQRAIRWCALCDKTPLDPPRLVCDTCWATRPRAARQAAYKAERGEQDG